MPLYAIMPECKQLVMSLGGEFLGGER